MLHWCICTKSITTCNLVGCVAKHFSAIHDVHYSVIVTLSTLYQTFLSNTSVIAFPSVLKHRCNSPYPPSILITMSKDLDLDDLELAGLTDAQLAELSEYIDPDVSCREHTHRERGRFGGGGRS